MIIETEPRNTISPYMFMQFMEPLGTADSSVDAGWDYLRERWQPKLIDVVKDLSPRMIRFGGCFASYYHWLEGVGPREQRKQILNLCWDGVYSNQVGTAEIIDFCKRINAEPLLVVNMESDGRMHWAYPKPGIDRFGTAKEAKEWVDYCNNPDNNLRISHGFKDPLNVKYWQIGNETSYDRKGYNVEQCSDATYRFAKSMREADGSIKLIAWCDSGWADKVMEKSFEYVDLMAFHYHFGSGLPNSPLYGTEYRKDFENTWNHLMSASSGLKTKLEEMKKVSLRIGKKLAMTEGHFSLQGRNRCEVLSTWAAGVAYARCIILQEQFSDVLEIATMADFFGNRWQVNAVMLPTPSNSGDAYLMPVGQVMKLFGKHIGSYALKINDIPDGIDVFASISPDKNKIYIHIVNTNYSSGVSIKLFDSEKEFISYEIKADPQEEITSLNPNCFNPVKNEFKSDSYYSHPASVSVLEFSI